MRSKGFSRIFSRSRYRRRARTWPNFPTSRWKSSESRRSVRGTRGFCLNDYAKRNTRFLKKNCVRISPWREYSRECSGWSSVCTESRCNALSRLIAGTMTYCFSRFFAMRIVSRGSTSTPLLGRTNRVARGWTIAECDASPVISCSYRQRFSPVTLRHRLVTFLHC